MRMGVVVSEAGMMKFLRLVSMVEVSPTMQALNSLKAVESRLMRCWTAAVWAMMVVDAVCICVEVCPLMCPPMAVRRCSNLCSTLLMAAVKVASISAMGSCDKLEIAVMASAMSWRVGRVSSLRAAWEGVAPSML